MAAAPLTEAASIDDVLRAMIQHSIDNPTHGVDCACKDEYRRVARRAMQRIFDEFPPTKPRSWPLTKQNASVLFQMLVRSLSW